MFSTKHREAIIAPVVETRLHAYLGGICRNHRSPALCIGGMPDHVHLLVALSPTVCVADLVMHVKKDSSKWMKAQAVREFAWQEGYGAFSIGRSQRDTLVAYIQNQKEHHGVRTFQEELLEHLVKYDVDYDPEFIWT